MRIGQEGCLELRGREVNAALKHVMEESLEAFGIGALGGVPVDDLLSGKEQREHRTHAIHRSTGKGGHGESRRTPFEGFVDLRMIEEITQHRNSGAHGKWIAGE